MVASRPASARRLLLVAALTAPLGCNVGDGSAASGTTVNNSFTSDSNDGEGSSSDTSETSEASSDSSSTDDGGGEGEPGDPCVQDEECVDELCAFGADANGQGYCAEPCDPGCPEGFDCEPATTSGGPGDYCLPEPVEQCGSCEVDADCGGPNDRCLELAGGKFCLVDCTEDDSVCDDTFTCGILTGSDIFAGKHCIPDNGICCYDPDTDQHGEGDQCEGPDCDQSNPDIHAGADELCDGVDNDCNDQIDDEPVDCAPPSCDLGVLGYFEEPGEICEVGGVCVAVESQVCGLYTCEGGGTMGNQCADACDAEDDSLCVPDAHCDASACIEDLANGQSCDEDSDCASSHCEGGICCASGECCSTGSDCDGFGVSVPLCDDPTTCQGSRDEVSCSTSYQCQTLDIADDSACESTTLAAGCNLNADIYCTGAVDQSVPSCAFDCSAHADCDADAFCNPDNDVCELKRADGQFCGTGDWCINGTCQGNACCTLGVNC